MTLLPGRRMGRFLWTSCALGLGVTALLASCSGYDNITYGTAVVTMSASDAAFSGFSSYVVDIDEITLTRNDGLVVEPLSELETVDLVKLRDRNELVEAPAVPIGTYTSLSIVLDYTEGAVITVDVNGVATTAAIEAVGGATMTTTTLVVTFDPNNPLVINAQQSVRLNIDMNLAASNTIDTSTSPPTVTAQPVLTATVAPEDQTVYRARGVFVVTQPATNDFIVNMRPFVDYVSALGALTVNVSDTTYFNINGVIYTGAAGLAAMSSLEVSTPIASYGTLGDFSTITPAFNATAVYAGTALESPLAGYLTGTISEVNGDTLSLHGVTYVASVSNGGGEGYLATVPVTIGSATTVTEDGVVASGLSTKSVSVGQVINISGQASIDSNNDLVMDATAGAIRLQPTPVWGTLNSAAAGSMSLDVLSLGAFEPAAFDFAGTGTSAANDALASSYEVNTGALNESTITAGTLLQATGLVAPFGSAPPDFTASSVSLGSATPQTLVVEWANGGAAKPFSGADSIGLVVDFANANFVTSSIHYIGTGPARTDLKSLPASPTIVFATSGLLTLAVGNDAAISVFNSAAGFAAALATTLNGTNLVYRLVCVGQYSDATNTFTATGVVVNLQTT